MCDCIHLTNEALKKDGLRLIVGIVFPMDGTPPYAYLPIETEKIDKGNRKKKTASFVPTYCPFCGEKREADNP